MKTTTPQVSIIIPAYNEEKHIGKLLDSIMKMDYPQKNLEIIVIDDGSTDRTPVIVSRYPVKVIKGPHRGVGVARNIGWRSANHDIILFLDSDLVVSKNFLKEMIKAFKKENVAAADCTTLIKNKKSLIARMLYLRNVLGLAIYDFPFVKLCKKKILEEVNGINPKYGYYDDWELAIRIKKKGYKIVRMRKAVVWHNEPETFQELWRQHKWAGRSIIFLWKGYKKELLKRLRFPLICSSLPVHIILLFSPSPFCFLGVIGLSLFLLVELTRSIKMYKLTKWNEAFLTPIFDFFTMVLFCIGMVIGIIDVRSKPKA